MLTPEQLEIVKKEVENFFGKMTFEAEINFSADQAQSWPVLSVGVTVEQPQILIGEKGETLIGIQHVLRLLVRKKIGAIQEPFYLDIDINEYKKKKIDYLKELAKEAAEEVAQNKKEKILPPMPAYERRVVHLELAQRSDVISESIGQEPERRVAIRPRL